MLDVVDPSAWAPAAPDPQHPDDRTGRMDAQRRRGRERHARRSDPSSMIDVTLTCGADVDAQTCGWVRAAFESAGARISRSLRLRARLSVSARYHSFCASAADSGTSCVATTTAGTDGAATSGQVIGRAAPAAYFSARAANAPTMLYSFYPQALIRQFASIDADLQFNQYDIFAEFNSDFSFYFKESGKSITPNQTDIEFVIAHELTHGLGFQTSWTDYSTYGKADPTLALPADAPDILAPPFFASGTSSQSIQVNSWQPLSVFDQHVLAMDNNNSTTRLIDLAYSMFTSGSTQFPSTLRAFIATLARSDPAATAYRLSTLPNGKLRFIPQTSQQQQQQQQQQRELVLTSSTRSGHYLPGTNIAHADHDTNAHTPDFLMIPAVGDLIGHTLDDIIANTSSGAGGGGGGIYGPRTLGVLAALGYASDAFPTAGDVSVHVNRDARVVVFDPNAATALSPPSLPITLLLLLLLLSRFP